MVWSRITTTKNSQQHRACRHNRQVHKFFMSSPSVNTTLWKTKAVSENQESVKMIISVVCFEAQVTIVDEFGRKSQGSQFYSSPVKARR